MGKPVHPLANLGLAGQYLNTLPASDISQRYFAGTAKYQSTFFNRALMYLTINQTYKTLLSFYPYEPMIKKNNQQYDNQFSSALSQGLIITAASWFTIFNLARKGKVLPVLNQYGKYFKTHRIFRQYIYTLLTPTAFLTGLVNWQHLNNAEHLWSTHARRMNQQITQDPSQTQYPKQLKGKSWIGSWMTTFFELPDIQKKRLNETNILLAPDYTQHEWEFAQQEQDGGDEEEQAESEESD